MEKLMNEAYYWVKIIHRSEWEPAQYTNHCPEDGAGYWYIIGSENQYYENEVDCVGPMITRPM